MQQESPTNPLQFYAQQSQFTDPGACAHMFDDLPSGIVELCRVVQGLVVHYCEGPMYGVEIPAHRRKEIDTRRVAAMLRRIRQLDGRTITTPRRPDRRLVGCCRDFSVLLCAMLRHQGTPARIRFGFSTYFRSDFLCDHVVCEYWKWDELRWVLVDAQMDERHRAMSHLDFDPHDIPRHRFLPAGGVWQRCRRGEVDPERCGVDEDIAGLWFVGRYVAHDLAALNRLEVLCWDAWGIGERDSDGAWTPQDLAALDRVAALTLGGNAVFSDLYRAYMDDPAFRAPATIHSYSPAGPYTTDLQGS